MIEDRRIDTNTQADYLWRLRRHLLPFFGPTPVNEIDRELCQRFKAAKLQEVTELRSALAAGAVVRGRTGRRERPLSPASIKKLIDTLAAILDEAVEDGHLDRNAARGKRMRVKAPKPTRTFLEMDELVALLDAAGEQDSPLVAQRARPRAGAASTTRGRVAQRLARPAAQRDRRGARLVKGDGELPRASLGAPHTGRLRRPTRVTCASATAPP